MVGLRAITRQPRIRDGIPGHAIVMCTPPPGVAEGRPLELTLCVELPERRTYYVTGRFRIPPGKHPWHGRVLPVTVDLADRERVRIEWDRVPGRTERIGAVQSQILARGGREALDEMLPRHH